MCVHQFIIYGIFSLGATAVALLNSTQNAFSLGIYKRTKIRVEKTFTHLIFLSTKILAEENIGSITNYDAAFNIYLGYKN